ncbi:hypothetical protein [Acinetobacter sp. ANC 4640]
MTFLYLALKLWRECTIAVLAFLLLLCMFLLNSKTGKLQQADAKCAAQIQKIELTQQTALKQENDKANQVSADYEQLKATQQVKTETIRSEVQKIVERPIYRDRDCFDNDGLQQLGKAISLGQTKLSSKLDDTVPKPDNPE